MQYLRPSRCPSHGGRRLCGLQGLFRHAATGAVAEGRRRREGGGTKGFTRCRGDRSSVRIRRVRRGRRRCGDRSQGEGRSKRGFASKMLGVPREKTWRQPNPTGLAGRSTAASGNATHSRWLRVGDWVQECMTHIRNEYCRCAGRSPAWWLARWAQPTEPPRSAPSCIVTPPCSRILLDCKSEESVRRW